MLFTLEDIFDSLINSLDNSGYNILNEIDTFYNDICTRYTSGKETELSDRKKR